MSRRGRRRSARHAATMAGVCAVATGIAGCQFTGFGSLPLPFTPGTGSGSYTVTAQMSDVTHLPPNSEVMVGNITVGTVTAIRFDHSGRWHADLTLSLPNRVKLPANATAVIGQKSLLGAEYVALAPPANAKPSGVLTDGAVIPMSRTSTYPSTEDVLAALSTVLNGGGLNQLATITRELNDTLGGHTAQVRELLRNVRVLAATLDTQRGTIVAAIANLNNLAATMRKQDATLTAAIDEIPGGLKVLNDDEGKLAQALAAVSNLSTVADKVINSSSANLIANLKNLQPVAAKLADSGKSLIGALNVLPTYPFPIASVQKGEKGDYGNLFLTLDLNVPDLEKLWLSGSPASGLAGDKPSTKQNNPLTAPLKIPALTRNGSGSGSAGGTSPGGSGGSGSGGSGGSGGILGGLSGGGG